MTNKQDVLIELNNLFGVESAPFSWFLIVSESAKNVLDSEQYLYFLSLLSRYQKQVEEDVWR
jgi:hypothetical protein